MRPLPAVLLDLHEDFATGKLVLKRGRISKTIDLVNGNPVSTASTPRDETLGFFLVNTGVISEEQHRIAVERAAQGGGKLGEALVAMRVLSIEQLIDQLGKQARHKLVQALRWPQGAWRFDDTEPVEGMQLRMVEVVLSGLKETAVEDLDRLARLEGMTFELTQRGTRLRHELRRTYGDRPIAMLGEGAALSELERCFGDRPKARLAIDALLLCDCASTVTAELGLGVEATATLPNDPTAVGGRALTRPAHAGSALFDILFEDLGDAYDGAKPLDFPEAEIHGEDSGVVSTAELSVASENTNDAAEARRDDCRREMRLTFSPGKTGAGRGDAGAPREMREQDLEGDVASELAIAGTKHGRHPAFTELLAELVSAEDIAAAITACATMLGYSTGHTIQVDGGRAL